MFFYLLFFISFKISHKHRFIIASFCLAALVFAGFFVKVNNGFELYFRTNMLSFILGMFAYVILFMKKGSDSSALNNTSDNSKSVLYFVLAAIILAYIWFQNYIAAFGKIDRFIKLGIPMFLVFLLLFSAFKERRVPKFMVVLGNISYSLYLVHTFVILGIDRLIFPVREFTVIGVLVIVVEIAISIVVAYISWYIIENKLTNILRNKLKV